MTKGLLLIVSILATTVIVGQTKSDLLADLNYLNEAVINGHGANYKAKGEIRLNNVIQEAEQIAMDSMSADEYTWWIRRGVFEIGCVHTSIKQNPLVKRDTNFRHFPCAIEATSEGVIIKNSTDSTLIGQKLLSINRVATDEIQARFATYRSNDGRTSVFADQYFDLVASRLVSEYFQNPDNYELETDQTVIDLKASDKAIFNTSKPKEEEYLIQNDKNYLLVQNGVAYLRVRSFDKSDIRFFKKTFEIIAEGEYKDLLIDLRYNTGGDRGAAVELTKHLVDSVFSYSILQPELKPRKYLNKKGKYYFFLSKVKFNIGNFYRGKKTEYGRAFRYQYSPSKKNRFSGNIHVATDGFTASASTMVTSWLKQYSNARFYGGQASGGFNGNNGGSFPLITLPKSQIVLKFPVYRLVLNQVSGQTDGIVPEIPLEPNMGYQELIDMVKGD